MPTEHSAIIGGSTADRVISCPGSNRLINTLPKWARERSSKYAKDGTACHDVMTTLLLDPEVEIPRVGLKLTTKDGVVTFTEEMRLGVERALAVYDSLFEQHPDLEFLVEQQVQFPGVEGAFGTSDLVGISRRAKISIVLDWKFGTGVGVAASYDLEDGFEMINRQLLYYAAAARASLPAMFPRDHRIMLAIVQPLLEDEDSRVTTAWVTHDELDEFEQLTADAVRLAATPDAPLEKGPHCRFAPCKPICPLWTAPLVDLVDNRKRELPELTNDELGHLMNVADVAQELIRAIQELAYAKLERGELVPGWKLVAKSAHRKWQLPDAEVLLALRKLKVTKAKALELKLKSPAGIERVLKKGQKLPEGLALAISSGNTLARADDPRPDASESTKALRDMAKRNLKQTLVSSLFED